MKDVQRWLKQQHLHTSSARSYLLPRDPVLMPTVLNQTRALAVQLNFLDADMISWQLLVEKYGAAMAGICLVLRLHLLHQCLDQLHKRRLRCIEVHRTARQLE